MCVCVVCGCVLYVFCVYVCVCFVYFLYMILTRCFKFVAYSDPDVNFLLFTCPGCNGT